MEFLLIPELVKAPVTSSCGNQWVPRPLNTAKPSSHHPWWSTLFLNESSMWPCVVCGGLVPGLWAYTSVLWPVSSIQCSGRWLQWSVFWSQTLFLPPNGVNSRQFVRVTRFDLCFKGILGKWTTRRWKQKHEGPAPQAGGILRTDPSSHTEETGRGGGKMGLDLRGTVKAELGWLAHNWTWVWKRERRQCFSSDNWLPFFSCEKAWRGTVT